MEECGFTPQRMIPTFVFYTEASKGLLPPLVMPLTLFMSKPADPKKQPRQTSDALNCETDCPIHLDRVRQVRSGVLSTSQAQQMAEFFAVLADPNRLRILSALALQELCVCDLAAVVKMGESAVSHQLRVLRSMRLVSYRREGRNIYYRLADHHVVNLYREVAEHLDEPEA